MAYTETFLATNGRWTTVAADAGDAFVQLQESGAVRVHYAGAAAAGDAPGIVLSQNGLQEISITGMVDGDVVSVLAVDDDSEVCVMGTGLAPT